jgi:hypothetical protein
MVRDAGFESGFKPSLIFVKTRLKPHFNWLYFNSTHFDHAKQITVFTKSFCQKLSEINRPKPPHKFICICAPEVRERAAQPVPSYGLAKPGLFSHLTAETGCPRFNQQEKLSIIIWQNHLFG